jgi:hypothetical protein
MAKSIRLSIRCRCAATSRRPSPGVAWAKRSNSTTVATTELKCTLSEGSQDYDLVGYTKEQIINDILDQYERHSAVPAFGALMQPL